MAFTPHNTAPPSPYYGHPGPRYDSPYTYPHPPQFGNGSYSSFPGLATPPPYHHPPNPHAPFPYPPPPQHRPPYPDNPPPTGPFIPQQNDQQPPRPPPSPVPGRPPAGISGPFIPSPVAQPPPKAGQHPSIINSYPSLYAPPVHYPNPPIPHARAHMQTAEVKLEIAAKGLWDRDLTSKSDPTCVIFLEERFGHHSHFRPQNPDAYGQERPSFYGVSDLTSIKWREVGRTECIKNNLNPHFKVQVTVPYKFEELQHIRLGLWDIDSKKSDLQTHDFLGDVRTTLGELVAARVWTADLTSSRAKDNKNFMGRKRDFGKITVIVHENRDGGKMLIKMSMAGQKLDRKDFIRSDPYFIVNQVGASSASSVSYLYRSEVIKYNLNPVWKPCQFHANIPKGGNKSDLKLEFHVYDKDKRKRDDVIGVAACTLSELEQLTSLPLINEAKRRKKKRHYKNSGTLEISSFRALAMPSLVDYLQGGLKLHFSVAIDLTASNGNPSDPSSLHYRQDPYAGNQYVNALVAVANVLSVYAPSDNRFAAFGFGAEIPGRPGVANLCFPLGLSVDPYCHGIQGILAAYNHALGSVKLSGPTNFAPLIDTVSRMAAQRPRTQTDQNYDVLLILTDGVVSDFDLTVERIITASKTVPLSIIIIGIGHRDFKKMDELDSDNELLRSADKKSQAARDICQFVAFRDYANAPPERLGAAVLAELPGNIVDFFVGACEPPIMPGQGAAIPNMRF